MADPLRYGCHVCQRTDLTITRDNMLRKHTANGKRRADGNPYCTGTVPEGVPEDAPQEDTTAVPAPPNPHRDPLPGGLHENAARAGTEIPPRPASVTEHPPCPFGTDGEHEFVFGECGCEYKDPDYVEPAPVLAAKVRVITGPDMLMGTGHSETEADAMDALMAPDRPSDGRDKLYRNGRYALPDPLTGNKRTWTRATTMAETLSDLYSLNLWRIRMVLIGLTRFPDLLDELREIDGNGEEGILDPKIHKDVLNKIGSKAQALAGSKVPANWGTEMHTCIERLSRDEITLAEVPDKYRAEVTAWAAAMQEADLSAVSHLIERRIAVPLYDTAGTFDQMNRVHRGRSIRLGNRVIRLNAGDHLIGDVKSGRNLDYGWGEISIQMALYAHGAREGKVARWDPDADSGDPDDPGAWLWEDIGVPHKSIRTDVGVVMHVPVQRQDDAPAECTLHWIDLEEGWKAVQLCEAVRDWRKAKGLHMPFSIAEVATSKPPVVREPSWKERFQAITTKDQGRTVYRQWLAAGGDPDSAQAVAYREIMKARVAQLTESTA